MVDLVERGVCPGESLDRLGVADGDGGPHAGAVVARLVAADQDLAGAVEPVDQGGGGAGFHVDRHGIVGSMTA